MTTGKAAIRAGIVGAGLMGKWHAHSIRRIGGRVVAIADHNLQAAQRLAEQVNTARAFANLEMIPRLR